MTRFRSASARPGVWTAGLCTLAGAQIALGIVGLALVAAGIVDWHSATVVRDWQRAVEIFAFVGIAGYVLSVGRNDARAIHLGALLLLIGLFYAQPPGEAVEMALSGPAADWVAIFRATPIDSFTPAAAWLFMRDFPRALDSRRSARLVDAIITLCIAMALVLCLANVLRALIPGAPGWLDLVYRGSPSSAYWTLVFAPLLPILPFVLWRTRHAPQEERGRVRLLGAGFVLFGFSPIVYTILAPVFPVVAKSDLVQSGVVPMNLLMLQGLAASISYCVLVEDVLDVRVVLRVVAQYSIARAVAWTLAVTPFALIAAIAWSGRAEPLASLLSDSRLFAMLGLVAAGVVALRLRRRVMLAVDRFFFREPYDSQALLASLAARSRDAESTASIAELAAGELEAALHVESVAVLAARVDDDEFVPVLGPVRGLPGSCALAGVLSRHSGPLPVDLAHLSEPLRDLPETDRVWIADSGAAVIVPLLGAGGAVTGLLTVGPKRSQLPFSREDGLMLEAVGTAMGVSIENRMLRDSAGARASQSEFKACECIDCGRVAGSDAESCPECGASLRPSALPRALVGKFELDRRVGQGAMGIVYRARDLVLGRDVALKTLPRTAPEDAARLRREARAMAAVTDPHLAVIYGAETWEGTPILVMEFLGGGTLEERLRTAPLAAHEAFSLSIEMAEALECAHSEGLLHRDVKPSNIGFTSTGEAKLLDFGLVRIIGEAGAQRPVSEFATDDSAIAGTPLYMSPEALGGERPEPGFDLWSLAVVTYEMVCGNHPFERENWARTYAAIRGGWNESLLGHLPAEARGMSHLFETCLAADRDRRPSTASELTAKLREARASVG